MKRVFVICYSLIFFAIVSNAQVFDDFSDGDFIANPQWHGDIQDFIVNEKYQLQLDAADGGNSDLYIRYNVIDSMEWRIYTKLDFNPSNSNRLKIFLMIDRPDLDSASGYFIKIGENGNDDNLKFYEIDKGVETLIGEGESGLFATAFEVNLKIVRLSSGIWSFQVQNTGQIFKEDFTVFNDKFLFDTAYFDLDMDYSKSRRDKFVFDDVYIAPFKPDKNAPKLVSAKLVDKTGVLLTFDEELDMASTSNPDNYIIEQNNIKATNIYFDINKPYQVLLQYSDEFESGLRYKIAVKNLKDLKGNKIEDPQFAYFFLIEYPDKGDLAINEMLFNPNKGGSDFVELINISKKFLNLKGMEIWNLTKEKGEFIQKDIILEEGEIICVSSDTNSIINDYFVPDTAVLIQNKLPGFDDDAGNVSLYFTKNNISVMIDSFDYSEEMHSSFVVDAEGLSLERKNPYLGTNDRFNWTSCSTIAGGATPGYKNSVFINQISDDNGSVVIKNKVFSPNNDGIDDELIIEYNLEKSENYANFYIFDPRGRLVTQLVNNETIGAKGIVVWNGYSGLSKVPIGIYLLYYNITGAGSKVIEGKKTIVLADYLK